MNSFTVGRRTADEIAANLRQKQTDSSVIDNVHFIAQGVQTSFRDKRLEPMLRVFYNRTAFQLPDNQRLRISLDTDLTFIREDHMDGQQRRQPTYNWRRHDVGIDYPFTQLKDADVLRFPYAVLETKLQTHLGQAPPPWLTSLVESHLVHEVPRFSKYLHGACHFYRNRLPLLPWWLAEMNVDIRKPRGENTGLTRSRSFKPLIDGRYRRAMIEEKERANQDAVVNETSTTTTTSSSRPSSKDTLLRLSSGGSSLKPLPQRFSTSEDPGVDFSCTTTTPQKKKTTKDYTTLQLPPPPHPSLVDRFFRRMMGNDECIPDEPRRSGDLIGMPVDEEKRSNKVKVRVEPKTFFANERTFISWLQFCALLLTVALNLMNFATDDSTRIVGK